MLKRFVAKNFRSLKELTVELDPLTALVGANGSGKSSVLRGIDLICGQRWPSLNALRPNDFAGGDQSAERGGFLRRDEQRVCALCAALGDGARDERAADALALTLVDDSHASQLDLELLSDSTSWRYATI